MRAMRRISAPTGTSSRITTAPTVPRSGAPSGPPKTPARRTNRPIGWHLFVGMHARVPEVILRVRLSPGAPSEAAARVDQAHLIGKELLMQSRIARSLVSGLAAAMLATGAGVAAAGTASAASSTTASVTSHHTAPTAKCRTVKGYWRTVKSHGKTTRVWVKPRTVCTR